MRGVYVWAMIAVAAVCGGACEASQPAPRAKTQFRVCVEDPIFIAFRDGAGPWQTQLRHDGNLYELDATDDYELVWAYGQDINSINSRLVVNETASTVGETVSDTACDDHDGTPTVHVTGQMVQEGEASMDGNGAGAGSGSAFDIPVTPGLHALVATTGALVGSGGGDVLIRRQQMISGDTTEPPVDFASEGRPKVAIPLTLMGLASDEPVSTLVALFPNASDITVVSERNDRVADVVPDALLEATDQEELDVYAEGRSAYTTFTGSQTSFDLLPPLTGITFDPKGPPRAAWDELPASFTSVVLDVQWTVEQVTPFVYLTLMYAYVDASWGWLEAHHATSLTLDTSAPGFDSDWTVDASEPDVNITLSLEIDSGDIDYYRTAGNAVAEGSQMLARPSRSHARPTLH